MHNNTRDTVRDILPESMYKVAHVPFLPTWYAQCTSKTTFATLGLPVANGPTCYNTNVGVGKVFFGMDPKTFDGVTLCNVRLFRNRHQSVTVKFL